jgi:hypothetical protein
MEQWGSVLPFDNCSPTPSHSQIQKPRQHGLNDKADSGVDSELGAEMAAVGVNRSFANVFSAAISCIDFPFAIRRSISISRRVIGSMS